MEIKKKKANFVRHIHEKARQNIENRVEYYSNQGNKGHKKVVLEPSD